MNDKTIQQSLRDFRVAVETLNVSVYIDIRRKLNALKSAFKKGGSK